MTATEKLKKLISISSHIDWVIFDEHAVAALKEQGYEDSDIDDMSIDDIRDAITDLFNVTLIERGDYVYIYEFEK